jgi:hypothetical protein
LEVSFIPPHYLINRKGAIPRRGDKWGSNGVTRWGRHPWGSKVLSAQALALALPGAEVPIVQVAAQVCPTAQVILAQHVGHVCLHRFG